MLSNGLLDGSEVTERGPDEDPGRKVENGPWFIVGSRYQATSPRTVRYQLQLIWYAGAGLADSSSGCLAVSRCCLPAASLAGVAGSATEDGRNAQSLKQVASRLQRAFQIQKTRVR